MLANLKDAFEGCSLSDFCFAKVCIYLFIFQQHLIPGDFMSGSSI